MGFRRAFTLDIRTFACPAFSPITVGLTCAKSRRARIVRKKALLFPGVSDFSIHA
jgi:hypothetical protein